MTGAVLDHIVINAKFQMDLAEEVFGQLGFNLTPRGRHSLGSTNHLMMFADDYLELLGIAEEEGHKRPDLSTVPRGLNGLVFKTGNADDAYARLQNLGMAGDPPRAFTRPLTLNDGSQHEARFRTVTASSDGFPSGRLYFCEHQTPEFIWRPEWLEHANGVTAFRELVIVAPNPMEAATRLAALLERVVEEGSAGESIIAFESGFALTFLKEEHYRQRFGDLARSGEGRETYFAALVLRTDMDKLRGKLDSGNDHYSVTETDNGLALVFEPFNTLIVFES